MLLVIYVRKSTKVLLFHHLHTPCLLHYSYKLLGRYSSIATASREASRISPNRIWPKMLEMHIAHKPNVHMFDENPFFKVSKVKLCTTRFLPWFFYARKSWKIVFIFVRYSSFIKIKAQIRLLFSHKSSY